MDHEGARSVGRASSRQRGYALLLMLAVVGFGALFFLARSADRLVLAPRTPASHLSPATADALRQAKEALTAYAATYPDTHSGETFGYLPLPDLGGHVDTSASKLEGKAAFGYTGNGQDQSVIGRLPWHTLNLPALKDEYGECLWYAVSGSFKNNPKTASMNWDTLGYLDLFTPDGLTSLSGGNPHARAVAVIFSAGPPLPGQSRSDSIETDDNLTITNCHGNYNVANYLDANGALSNYFAGSTHNAMDSNTAAVKQLLASPLPGSTGNQTLNDRAVYITSDDIFRVIKRRTGFAPFINNLAASIATCLTNHMVGSALPTPANPVSHGVVTKGKVPAICISGNIFPHWQDQFFYLKCDNNSTCLDGNVGGSTIHWQGALIFAGERNATQTRASSSDRSNFANYLEGNNLSTFTGPSKVLEGVLSFTVPSNGSPASQDVLICLPTPCS